MRIPVVAIAALGFSLGAATGCGGSAGAGSCLITDTESGDTFHECLTYTGSAYAGDESAIKQACTSQGNATYSSDACPTSSAGYCYLQKGTPGEVKWTFTDTAPDSGAVTLQSACTEAGGVYSAT